MKKLAINGGPKVRKKFFPSYDVIDEREIRAVSRVLRSGVLSRFLGAWHPDFFGGPQIQALENEWSNYFKVKNAISVNSATSGLISALGAVGIGLGDEVIVSPYSMSISATAPLFYGATPVFADVEPKYFCLDPKSIEAKITSRTKAIIVVDLFGHPYDAEAVNKIARKHKLIVIEDAAQAPAVKYKNKYAGTLGDIGIFSLNYHKHIHCGEGGMVVTNNDKFADRVRLIRNHAEAVVEKKGTKDLTNMLGFNFRMTEIEASIAREQLKKLPSLIEKRVKNVNYISKKLSTIKFISFAEPRPLAEHAYYVHPFLFDEKLAGVSRDIFIEAVKAELMPTKRREGEGVKINSGYTKPLYLLPIFRKKRGVCPNVEKLHFKELVFHELMHPNMKKADLDDVVKSFIKVAENILELKQ